MDELPDSDGLHKFVQMRKATRRISSLVLPFEKVEQIRQFIVEFGQRDRLLRFGIPPRTTMLLQGPSGNGKTAIGECIATEMSMKYGVVNMADIISQYLGGTVRNLHELMVWTQQNRSVVLFDECDSLLTKRSQDSSCNREMARVVNEMLTSLDASRQESVYLFATNHAAELDPAFKRRIGLKLHIQSPTIAGKEELISRLLKKWPFVPADGLWRQEALDAPSFAECEQMVMNAAREMIVSGKV